MSLFLGTAHCFPTTTAIAPSAEETAAIRHTHPSPVKPIDNWWGGRQRLIAPYINTTRLRFLSKKGQLLLNTVTHCGEIQQHQMLLPPQAQRGLRLDQPAFQLRQAALLALKIDQTSLQGIDPLQGWPKDPQSNAHSQQQTNQQQNPDSDG